ncbi:hypothetical protein EJF36_18470 [Bacillus sp. HMF5848]|uniref:hypothetical protein n=1 Tax=Bacillus sp. HMF5848 TaxID=2495421 RepID=UPI000F7B9CD5|nr:hypothetical protein [Bacillus sp. HMF5848]RSK28694.1 hypothetical protein EJF36_18470 [Bacillus sp. HMF5848]
MQVSVTSSLNAYSQTLQSSLLGRSNLKAMQETYQAFLETKPTQVYDPEVKASMIPDLQHIKGPRSPYEHIVRELTLPMGTFSDPIIPPKVVKEAIQKYKDIMTMMTQGPSSRMQMKA